MKNAYCCYQQRSYYCNYRKNCFTYIFLFHLLYIILFKYLQDTPYYLGRMR